MALECFQLNGATALYEASRMGFADVVSILLSFGADVDIQVRATRGWRGELDFHAYPLSTPHCLET
jgi:ankyrin repeat protein